ncbi:hypothetical protein NX059_000455 [Plenodomus lindquistii]|nr:hypothetical protein NX059_000455 [Plenodomus lindquistii]
MFTIHRKWHPDAADSAKPSYTSPLRHIQATLLAAQRYTHIAAKYAVKYDATRSAVLHTYMPTCQQCQRKHARLVRLLFDWLHDAAFSACKVGLLHVVQVAREGLWHSGRQVRVLESARLRCRLVDRWKNCQPFSESPAFTFRMALRGVAVRCSM